MAWLSKEEKDTIFPELSVNRSRQKEDDGADLLWFGFVHKGNGLIKGGRLV